MAQTRKARKLLERLRELNSTGLCYVHHDRQFYEVAHAWFLWHSAYRQLGAPYKLDGQQIKIAPLAPGYGLAYTDYGLAVSDLRTQQPGPSIQSNYWLTLRRLLEYNPNGRYTTLDDIRRMISEEAFPEQARVIEIRYGQVA